MSVPFVEFSGEAAQRLACLAGDLLNNITDSALNLGIGRPLFSPDFAGFGHFSHGFVQCVPALYRLTRRSACALWPAKFSIWHSREQYSPISALALGVHRW
jgi:hypothetical protein